MGPVNVSVGLMTGFIVGAVLGFAWAQGTRTALSKHTSTAVDSQAVTVRVDYRAAALDGLYSAFSNR